MNIANLINKIKEINSAVIIPDNDSWHLTPPNIGAIPIDINKYNQFSKINLPIENTRSGPIIENKEKAISAIRSATNYKPEWGNEEVLGTDALAWYASFHYTNYWGIYIPYTGLLRFASNFLNIVNDPELAIHLAWDGLLAHESMHYGIDVACTQLEVISNSPIYLNDHSILKSAEGHIPLEEQIAEASMLRFFKTLNLSKYNLDLASREEIFEEMVKKSARAPSGYRDGFKCIQKKLFTQQLDSYLYRLCQLSPLSITFNQVINFLELSGLVPHNSNGFYNPSNINFSECPIHVFDDTPSNSSLSNVMHFITHISHIEEEPGFIKKVIEKDFLKKWIKTKELMGNPSYPKNRDNLDFKRWEDEDRPAEGVRVWSVRVGSNTNMRAHLDEHIVTKRWIATKFDNADKMGHHKNRK